MELDRESWVRDDRAEERASLGRPSGSRQREALVQRVEAQPGETMVTVVLLLAISAEQRPCQIASLERLREGPNSATEPGELLAPELALALELQSSRRQRPQ